tara:strand:- start:3165 stop:4778 length:1614 start_codon:yes stop_codon:yes gene_type:complete
MSVYQDQQIYDQFLGQALNRASEYQNIGQSYLDQVQQFKEGEGEQKVLGEELLFTTLPGIFPEAGRVIQSASKIYKSVQELKTRGESIMSKLQTLPEDLKTLAKGKYDEISSLVKNGSNESLSKANALFSDLKSQASTLVETTKSNVSDLISSAKDNLASINPEDVLNTIKSSLPSELSSREALRENAFKFRDDAKATLQKLSDATDSQISDLRDRLSTATESEKANINKSIQDLKDNYNKVGSSVKSKLEEVKQTSIDRFNEITPLESVQQKVSTVLSEAKIPVSITHTAPEELVNRYTSAKANAQELASKFMNENNPDIKASLSTALENAKTDIRTSSRLLELNQPESILSKIGSGFGGIMDIGSVTGGVLGTLEEAKGQMRNTAQRVQTGLMQEQATDILAQRGSQALQAVRSQFGGTEELAMKASSEAQSQAGKLASTAQEGFQSLKSTVGDVAEQVASKGTDILGSIADKGVLETVGELSGISAIPVVGEIVGLGGLLWGAVSGIEDLFKHKDSAPTPQVTQQAGLVHQSGI